VTIDGAWHDTPCDVLIALHARKSAEAIQVFHDAHPDAPVVIALTGTLNPQTLPDNDNIPGNHYAYSVHLDGQLFMQTGRMIAYYPADGSGIRFEPLTAASVGGFVRSTVVIGDAAAPGTGLATVTVGPHAVTTSIAAMADIRRIGLSITAGLSVMASSSSYLL
jgi:hypothetical protein